MNVFYFLISLIISFNLIAMEKEDSSDLSDVNQQLFSAVKNNEIQKIFPLIQAGADINCQNKNGNTPLHKAAQYYKRDMIIHLATFSPDFLITNNNGESVKDALHAMQYDNFLSRCIKDYQKVCDDDCDKDLNPDNCTKEITNTVNYYKQLKAPSWPIEQSLSYIESYNWKHEKLIAPLVKVLLENGARSDLPRSKFFPNPPLHTVAAYGLVNTLELLVKHAQTVDHLDYKKNTPLHIAIKQEEKDCVEILLKNGASVNAVDQYGRTPLHNTAFLENQRNAIIKLLLKYNLDFSIKDHDGKTASQLIKNPINGPLGWIANPVSNYLNQSTIKAIQDAEASSNDQDLFQSKL